jgi:hypothetical protein
MTNQDESVSTGLADQPLDVRRARERKGQRELDERLTAVLRNCTRWQSI